MRGSRKTGVTIPSLMGIIPAHAGLTLHSVVGNQDKGDHPRACGAHGTFKEGEVVDSGIIPAHAGLTAQG